MTDHDGNTLVEGSCALCRTCWLYWRMRDPRLEHMLGTCPYGGPFVGVRLGYADGEVEAARSRCYG